MGLHTEEHCLGEDKQQISAHPPCLNQHAAANFISNFSELLLRKRTEEKLQRWHDEEVQALFELATPEWTNGRIAAKLKCKTQAEKRCMKS